MSGDVGVVQTYVTRPAQNTWQEGERIYNAAGARYDWLDRSVSGWLKSHSVNQTAQNVALAFFRALPEITAVALLMTGASIGAFLAGCIWTGKAIIILTPFLKLLVYFNEPGQTFAAAWQEVKTRANQQFQYMIPAVAFAGTTLGVLNLIGGINNVSMSSISSVPIWATVAALALQHISGIHLPPRFDVLDSSLGEGVTSQTTPPAPTLTNNSSAVSQTTNQPTPPTTTPQPPVVRQEGQVTQSPPTTAQQPPAPATQQSHPQTQQTTPQTTTTSVSNLVTTNTEEEDNDEEETEEETSSTAATTTQPAPQHYVYEATTPQHTSNIAATTPSTTSRTPATRQSRLVIDVTKPKVSRKNP
jgi:hypothetical protein